MDDPGLASEMIQLLRDELERIRAQIREGQSVRKEEQLIYLEGFEDSLTSMVTPAELFNLQEENAQLRKEVETAQAKLTTLTDDCQDVDDKAEAECLAEKVAARRDECQQHKLSKAQLKDTASEMAEHLKELKEKHADSLERLTMLDGELVGNK
ncbi:hypothetical protein TRAPUB_10777 [Trametes pubescens]|uniref:Uncharacterized protein n=1 Tax=Trametes pubescens TaxID=154538 RepID=A0A1M2VYJ3_TRAPU|nr:hypothetical protein TRAPUB_10777 [Trametes pubescens]